MGQPRLRHFVAAGLLAAIGGTLYGTALRPTQAVQPAGRVIPDHVPGSRQHRLTVFDPGGTPLGTGGVHELHAAG